MINSQNTLLIEDIDYDNISDTICVNPILSKIECKLSTHHFEAIYSKNIYIDEMSDMGSRLLSSDRGFTYSFDWMRAGQSCDFEYEVETKRIRAILANYYALGNVVNDGKEETTIDLITGKIVGEIYFFDYKEERLIKENYRSIITPLPLIYLEDFDDDIIIDLWSANF